MTTYIGTLTEMTCWCGIHHAVPQELAEYQERCHHDGRQVPDIYCPLGHAHVPSGKARWLTEREKNERLVAQLTSANDQLQAEKRSNAALRGAATRQAKRSRAGACPCCDRSFENLARHMATKHPDYGKAAE